MSEAATTELKLPRTPVAGEPDAGPAPIREGTYWIAVAVLCIVAVSLGPILFTPRDYLYWMALVAVTAVGCALGATLLRRTWWLGERRAGVQHVIRRARSTLEDAWEGATPQTKREFALQLLARLDELQQRVPRAGRDELQGIETDARECGRKRAHWLSTTCIACEGVSSVRQMELWGVPKNYLKGQLQPLLALTQGAEPSASALEQLFDEYDYWEHYTEWYVRRVLPPIVLVLVALFLESLGWALYHAMWRRNLLPGFLLAGASGAALSILLKQSAMVVYGQLIKSWLGMAARFATGLVAATLGFGLLGWGVLGIGFGGGASGDTPVNFATMVRECSSCVDDEQPRVWCDAPAPGKHPPDEHRGRGAPDAGVPADAGPASPPPDDLGAEEATPRKATPDPAKGAGGAKRIKDGGTTPSKSPCSVAWMAGLLGVGLLFGFSERAFMGILANFDGQFGAQEQVTSEAASATPAPAPPQVDARSAPPAAPAAPPAQNDELLDPDPQSARDDH
jgi:hypothetical protein